MPRSEGDLQAQAAPRAPQDLPNLHQVDQLGLEDQGQEDLGKEGQDAELLLRDQLSSHQLSFPNLLEK